MISFFLLLLSSLTLPVTPARLYSLPEDTHAFPKFAVSFLNGHPILNQTAQYWLTHGLGGGEREFMGQPWHTGPNSPSYQRNEIDAGDTLDDTPAQVDASSFSDDNYTLEHMRMGPKDSYLCLIPKPSESASSRQHEDSDSDPTPARSWSLLQPLSGTCLYHRQGWFTYSYCHNKEIRQFKELAQPQARLPGTYRPEEDPEWESYTLGLAPRSEEEPVADLTVAERNAQAANLELARNAGSRYLVQRWGDGTMCDKTGKPREVEVQFHCSMVMTDHILFVKETKTCSYVLVIHTPRLCGEPGFKSRRDSGEETPIRCREVVDTLPSIDGQHHQWPRGLPTGDTPMKLGRRKTVLPSPQPAVASSRQSSSQGNEEESPSTEKTQEQQLYDELIQKTLDIIMANSGGGQQDGGPAVGAITGSKRRAANAYVEDGDIIVEYLDEDDLEEGSETSKRIVEALRAAGHEVRTERVDSKGSKKGDGRSGSSQKDSRNSKESKSRKPAPRRLFGGRFEL
ncbi:hypothetical protein FA15DRAFT_663134 [Coprinopsis marcescibilis]|uniref:Protein OS-9 homolog n=1 Tax=Coprinopsis marcescibilis TaxID=230819 RepID=A0A5C3LBP9_COPMA|nr:hypothetical protein FA15DRAFT_663134 [Coprinopsis marcescibilis]